MLNDLRAKRKKFGLMLALALAVAMLLAVAGLTVPGCLLTGAAALGLGLPFIHYNEMVHKMKKQPPKQTIAYLHGYRGGATVCFDPETKAFSLLCADGKAEPVAAGRAIELLRGEGNLDGAHAVEKLRGLAPDSDLVYICPYSAGLGKSSLTYSRALGRCVIRSDHSGQTTVVDAAEAAEQLCRRGLYHFVPKLEALSGQDFSEVVERCAREKRVREMESCRPSAEGEVHERPSEFGALTEVFHNGFWIPDPGRCEIRPGSEAAFEAYRAEQIQSAVRTIPEPAAGVGSGRTFFDKTMNQYRWMVCLEDSRTYFLTMHFDGDKRFLKYALDAEVADDYHIDFDLDGERKLRGYLGAASPTALLHEVMIEFLKTGEPAQLFAMAHSVCTAVHHFG